MSIVPPYVPPDVGSPRGSRRLGLVSLVCGLLCCAPPAAIAGVVLGAMALRSQQRQIGGKPVAVIGLALGFGGIGFLLWFLYVAIVFAEPARKCSELFIADLAAGRLSSAKARCSDNFEQDLATLSAVITPLGSLQGVTGGSPMYQSDRRHHTLALTLAGTANLAGGQRNYEVGIVKENSLLKILEFDWVP